MQNQNRNIDSRNKTYRWVAEDMEYRDTRYRHFIMVSNQFYRMLAMWGDEGSKNPIPLRTVPCPTDTIRYVDHVINPGLESIYLHELEKLRTIKKASNETLLFHGITELCMEEILRTNFSIDLNPTGGNDGVMRTRWMAYGKGVYFSKYPQVSLMYSEVLIICKVILGKSERHFPLLTPAVQEIPEAFDSTIILA